VRDDFVFSPFDKLRVRIGADAKRKPHPDPVEG
jgi:hypothetical protein